MPPEETEMLEAIAAPRQFALLDLLKRNREAFLDRHGSADDFYARMYSGTTYALWTVSAPAIARHCHGLVLDAGSGRGGWRAAIERTGSTYHSIELAPRGGHQPTWMGDVTGMTDVPAEQFDTIVCQQVLEHVRHPRRALREIYRTIKPGGKVVLSAPHLSRRHELPHDYYRYTQEGLTALFRDEGFEPLEVLPYGGILTFLHHQVSTLFLGIFTGVPVLGKMLIALNAPFSWLFDRLDPLIDRGRLFPLGVLVVARRGDTRRITA